MAVWIPSPNFYSGRRRPLAFIVWHSTEGAETTGAARGVARWWFGVKASNVSAHVVVDAADVVECVKPENTAWHCANGNADGYGIEIVGKASQDTSGWADSYSLAAIRNACGWIRSVPALAGIPARWLSDDQLRRHERGHTTHLQVSRVLGGTDHHDPGPDFPRDYVMQQLGGSAPAPTPTTGPDSLPTLKQGDSGPAVRSLQDWSNRFGWKPPLPLLTVDGQYGPKTTAVVKAAQAQCGVTGPDADGRNVGPRTKAAFWARGWRG